MAYNKDRAIAVRPEAEMLLCCARTQMDTARSERIRQLLQQEIDWSYLLQLALQHRVMPLLSWQLNAICPEAVPKATLEQLRGYFHANAQRNLFLLGELFRLLNLFQVHTIRAIPFKGPVLAVLTYGNLSLRQFGDLDFLVHKQDIRRATRLLVAQGYHTANQLDGDHEEGSPLSKYHVFVRDDGRVKVDLQWQISGKFFSFQLSAERLWERLEPISLAATTVLNLPPEDLLLLLCMHGCKHLWERLRWICDVAEFIRVHQEIDWERVMDQAGSMGSERMLRLGLFLAHDLLGATLSDPVLRRVQADPVVKSVAGEVRPKLFADIPERPGDVERLIFYFRMRKGWRDRLGYSSGYLVQYLRIALVPSAKDRALLPLPAFLSFLYYLVRPIRMVGKYGLRPWKWKHLLPHRFDLDEVH